MEIDKLEHSRGMSLDAPTYALLILAGAVTAITAIVVAIIHFL